MGGGEITTLKAEKKGGFKKNPMKGKGVLYREGRKRDYQKPEKVEGAPGEK